MRVFIGFLLLLSACPYWARTHDESYNYGDRMIANNLSPNEAGAEIAAADERARQQELENQRFDAGFYQQLHCPPSETPAWQSASAIEKRDMMIDCRKKGVFVDAGVVH